MKKVSTAAALTTKNVSQPKLTIGLDLGDRSSWYCVLDERGEVVLEQKLGTTPKAMREVFRSMPRCRIALETGMHSPWVSRVLSELGHEVIVAHARNVRLIGESRKKDDRLDARTLPRLARIDPQLLCPVKHRSAKAQADLTVIRARAGLVRARTALVNTARGLAKSYGERLRGCNVRNMNPEKADGLSPELQTALQPLLAGIELLSEQIREYNERIERLAQESYPQVLLLQGAQHILGPFGADSDLRRWGLKLAERGGRNGKKRAIIATARKLAVLLHRLWVSAEVYEPLRNRSRRTMPAAA